MGDRGRAGGGYLHHRLYQRKTVAPDLILGSQATNDRYDMKRLIDPKRCTIVLLAGLNLLLLAALLLSVSSLPQAFAQARGKTGEFVAVTAKAPARSYDVLYAIDSREQLLYAFYPTRAAGGQLTWSAPRDLRKDFEPN